MGVPDGHGAHAPTAGRERLALLDALRGFALFGVLLVNLRSFSLYGFLTPAAKADLPTAGIDRLLGTLTAMAVDGTSITLFSILFGVGFAMQMQRAAGQPGRVARHARRMLVLLAIGVVHAWLFWWGDILRYYAVLGLVLAPFARLPTVLLVALGGLVLLVLPLLLQPLVPSLLPAQASAAESAALSLAAFSDDNWAAMLQANFERDLRMRIAVWVLPTYVLGRLLIGMAFVHSGVLLDAPAHLRFWRRLCVVALLLGIAMTVALLLREHAGTSPSLAWLGEPTGKMLLRVIRNAVPLALALFYLSAFVLVFRTPAGQRWLGWLAPVGRMALTNYLAQTLIAIALFYGIGLGIGPRFGLLGVSVAAVSIFLLQAAASTWWLARFRFGPMEWLWRNLTYGRVHPLRRARAAADEDAALAAATVR